MLDAYLNTGQSPPFEMAFAQVAAGPTLAVPGEAAHHDQAAEQRIVTAYDDLTGELTTSYSPARDATDRTVYYGNLASLASHTDSGASCFVGASGSTSFNPGPGSAFFLIVGNNGSEEGSYGPDSAGPGRPEDPGTLLCDLPQNLAGVTCE